jgi:hypothetical protein
LKARKLFGSKSVARGLAAVVLASALAATAAAAPHAASAEATQPPLYAPVASAATTASAAPTGSVDASPAILSPAPSPAPAAAKPEKLSMKQRVAKIGRDRGLSSKAVSALLWICKHESGFHPSEVSSAGCHGLFQLSRKMSTGHPWKNPEWNTKRAIKYMKGRYGSVLKAKAFWAAHHWY